jgi:hypothetical protein
MLADCGLIIGLGGESMNKQIQVNLKENKVRIYEVGKPVAEFSVVTGPATKHLLKHKGGLRILNKATGDTSKGLINFVQILGNFGFHSDHWHHDKRHHHLLSAIPGAHSHGCIRIHHDESKLFFDRVGIGDPVVIVPESWQAPDFGTPASDN